MIKVYSVLLTSCIYLILVTSASGKETDILNNFLIIGFL